MSTTNINNHDFAKILCFVVLDNEWLYDIKNYHQKYLLIHFFSFPGNQVWYQIPNAPNIKLNAFAFPKVYKTENSSDSKLYGSIKRAICKQKFDERAVCKCGRTFAYKSNLTYHKKWECGQILNCFKCYKKFTVKSHLLKHLKTCSMSG